jgi:hypothetical protein
MANHKIILIFLLFAPLFFASCSKTVKTTIFTERFSILSNGIIIDNLNNCEWFVGPDKDMDWFEANEWARSLNLNGKIWRLPTRKELNSLFIKGEGQRNMPPIFKTSGWEIWTKESWTNSHAWLFSFILGDSKAWDRRYSTNRRAFAIRLNIIDYYELAQR